MCSTSDFVPELIYFNGLGKAETTRQMFILAGIDFKDTRFKNREEWIAMKNGGEIKFPFGQVPILRVTPKVTICQSNAIEYYVAKKHGFLGENLCQETMHVMVSNCVDDVVKAFAGIYNKTDEEKKVVIDNYKKDLAEGFLTKLTDLLKPNSENSEFFTGKKLGLGDLRVFGVLQQFERYGIEVPEAAYPNLNKLKKTIESQPKLKTWLDARLPTAF